MKLPLITAALRQSFPPRGSLIYFLILSLPRLTGEGLLLPFNYFA